MTQALTREQCRELDRRAIEVLGVPGIVLMENAARQAADLAMRMLDGERTGRVLILCGVGNNGGDGLAVARHLHARGVLASIGLFGDPHAYKDDALTNWRIVQNLGLRVEPASVERIAAERWDLVIDAIFGTGLNHPPQPPFPAIADAVNRCGAAVLAIDVPSGLDADAGLPLGACIRATRTITFVAVKQGFLRRGARRWTGRVHVADIGVRLPPA